VLFPGETFFVIRYSTFVISAKPITFVVANP